MDINEREENLCALEDKFLFHLDDLLQFLFPPKLQHPSAAGRLFTFAYHGPLVDGTIRTGPRGNHALAEYELAEMCAQFERENIIQVYLHRPRDLGLLTNAEQAAIISQADAHLKSAKGKALLPSISKKDVMTLLELLPQTADGRYSFHSAQKVIIDFRQRLIKEYKLVFPKLTSKAENKVHTRATQLRTSSLQSDFDGPLPTLKNSAHKSTSKHKGTAGHHLVSDTVAPTTMFLKMQGLSNPDLIEQNTSYLSKHAFRISGVDNQATAAQLISNVRLLRDVPPYIPDPFEPPINSKTGITSSSHMLTTSSAAFSGRTRAKWNDTASLTRSGVGSFVDAVPSSSTWKRKATLY